LIIENCDIICVFCLHCLIGVIKVCSTGSAVNINFILLLVNINFILLLVNINFILLLVNINFMKF